MILKPQHPPISSDNPSLNTYRTTVACQKTPPSTELQIPATVTTLISCNTVKTFQKYILVAVNFDYFR